MAIYVDPTKNNFPGLDRGFNQRFVLSPNLSVDSRQGVYLVETSQDIIDTLNDITTDIGINPGEVRAVSGGHCYENFVYQDENAGSSGYTKYVIDLSNMRRISEETIDSTTYVVVEPGASNWLIQNTLHSKYGAVIPGGSCYSVCAGGHISGGGYGLLSRLHGLTVDYLSGVEMVVPNLESTPAFKLRQFSPLSDSDGLDWASRGGGAGHFGIITKFYFEKSKLPPSPESAIFVALPVPWSQFRANSANFAAFLKAYFTACSNLPGQAFALGKFSVDTGEADAIMSIVVQIAYGASSGHSAAYGGIELAALPTQGDANAVLDAFSLELAQWVSAPTRSVFAGRKFKIAGHPVTLAVNLDEIYDLPWIDLTQMLNGSGENQKGKYKSCNMISNFVDAEAEAIFKMLADGDASNPMPASVDKSQTLVQIDSYGLQINALDAYAEKTAVAARNSNLKLQYQTYWKKMEGEVQSPDAEIISWFNTAYNNVYTASQPLNPDGFPRWDGKYQGCYFNYPDIQIGVNVGHVGDPPIGVTSSERFENVYFGADVANRLRDIKGNIDSGDVFSFAQSIPLPADQNS